LTDLETRVFRKAALQEVIDECPGVAARIFEVIAREEAWLLERITTLGQRNAAQCITHLLLELGDRLSIADPGVDPNAYTLPLNQEQIGSVAGITSVHVSRTLKQLSDDGLLCMNGDQVEIHDRAACEAFSEYDLRRMRLERPDD
jgi:CRP-like cAMP-binding protein